MTMMYGLIMPIYFPLLLIGLINMAYMDMILLIWFYRKPPVYDVNMDIEASKILRSTPIMMFLVLYWALGNP